MKYFVSSIIPKISAFSQKLDKISIICNRKWTIIDDEGDPTTYIFRDKKELLIIKHGVVKKASWDIINKDDIMIEVDGETLMFKQAFIDDNIFVLNLYSTNNYLHLVDQEKANIKTISQLEQMLKKKYLPEKPQIVVENKPEKSEEPLFSVINEGDNDNFVFWMFMIALMIVLCAVGIVLTR